MKSKKKFICEICSRKMTYFEILKLAFGPQGDREFICKCNSVLKFKENLFFRYLPPLLGAGIIFISKTFMFIAIWLILVTIAVILYFVSLKKLVRNREIGDGVNLITY